MIPRDPGKRIRIRRCLFATQFLFLATKILVSVLVTGDFISLMIQSIAFLIFFSYVPWALVCDFRTAKEVRLEWERIRRVRRGEEPLGGSALEDKGKKNRWRSDRAWQEVLFLILQGTCWLVSAVFAGIQGGPAACQQAVLQGAIINSLDSLVPDQAVAQFCNGMTANIALSCIGVIFTLLWLWWVCYSVKTLRKFEKTTKPDGQEVMIVREKVWRKSMARLLRRDEDDDVNGIKRIVTGGLVDLIELESRRSVNRRRSDNDYDHERGSGRGHGARHGSGRMVMSPGLGLGASTPRPSQESVISSEADRDRARSPAYGSETGTGTGHGQRRDTAAILESLPRTRGDMPPPPYIGQPQSEGTNTNTLSSSGEGTAISHESPNSNQALLGTSLGSGSASAGHTTMSSSRPLPLAPPEVERVVDRKMDEMAGGTYMSGEGMDAFTATRLGLGPAITSAQMRTTGMGGPAASGSGAGLGSGTRMEDIVDNKLDTYASRSPTDRQITAGPSGHVRQETIEQLVDRKIALGDPTTPPSSSSNTHPTIAQSPPSFNHGDRIPTQRYSEEVPHFTSSPIGLSDTSSPTHSHGLLTSTWPGSNPPPSFHAHTLPSFSPDQTRHSTSDSANYVNGGRKGKAAEAGFSIHPPHFQHSNSATLPRAGAGTGGSTYSRSPTSGNGDGEMTLEEMIELKMASLRAQSQSQTQSQSRSQFKSGSPAPSEARPSVQEERERPHAITSRSGDSTQGTETATGRSRGSRGKRKGKGKGRARAGSDPGPKLPKHDETDEEGSEEV